MSLSIQYEAVHDAEMRLANTIVVYDGNPVVVDRIEAVETDDIFRVHFRQLPLGTKAGERKFISSRKFDLAPFKVGYVEVSGALLYVSRAPRRNQQQGLSPGNTAFMRNGMHTDPREWWNHLLSAPDFEKAFHNKRDNYEACLWSVRGGNPFAILSREFALKPDGNFSELVFLFHKEQKVGYITDDNRVRLAPKSKCLRECLLELGAKVV